MRLQGSSPRSNALLASPLPQQQQHEAVYLLLPYFVCFQVAAEAARLLGAAGPVPSTALTEQFNEALCAVAFDRNNIANNQSVVSAAITGLVVPSRSPQPMMWSRVGGVSCMSEAVSADHLSAKQTAQHSIESLLSVSQQQPGAEHGQEVVCMPAVYLSVFVQEIYLSVLPRLPEAIRNAVKSRTISWVRETPCSCAMCGVAGGSTECTRLFDAAPCPACKQCMRLP